MAHWQSAWLACPIPCAPFPASHTPGVATNTCCSSTHEDQPFKVTLDHRVGSRPVKARVLLCLKQRNPNPGVPEQRWAGFVSICLSSFPHSGPCSTSRDVPDDLAGPCFPSALSTSFVAYRGTHSPLWACFLVESTKQASLPFCHCVP